MKNASKIAVFAAAVIAVVGIILYATRRKRQETEIDLVGNVQGCITVPGNFTPWTGDFSQTDWGGLKNGVKEHLGHDPEDLSFRALVEGFFKAIDVEPKGAYVRYFQKDLKVWLGSTQALPHWEVERAILKCKN